MTTCRAPQCFRYMLRSCSQLPCRSPKGRVQAMPGERGHYKGAPRGPPTKNCGGLTEFTPPTSTEGPSLRHSLPPRCPSISFTGAPGTKRRRRRAEVQVHGSENRGGSGCAWSQGELVPLSVYQGLPIPEQRGHHKTLIPHHVSPAISSCVGCTLGRHLTSSFG